VQLYGRFVLFWVFEDSHVAVAMATHANMDSIQDDDAEETCGAHDSQNEGRIQLVNERVPWNRHLPAGAHEVKWIVPITLLCH
jgi:hypothetical protein